LAPKKILGEKVLKIPANINSNPITALSVRKSPIFPCPAGNRGRETMMMSDFRPEVEIWPFHAYAVKNMQYNPYCILVLQEQFGRCVLAMGQIPRSSERISSLI